MRARWLLLAVIAWTAFAQPPQAATDVEAVVTTDLGTFRFEFAPEKAPKHVEQFIARARQGYYDGSAFHRAVANGLIQGGDPLLKNPKTPRAQWGAGGLNLMASEISDLKHERGVVSAFGFPGKPNSDSAQFFVCAAAQMGLDGKYSAFGRVTEGMDVVEKISQVPLDANGLAEKPVRILKITIEKKRAEPFVDAGVDELRKTVTLKTTLGSIRIKMEPDWAPNHVRRFLMLTQTGWYDGTVFHRIAKAFVVQGGTAAGRVVGQVPGEIHYADRFVKPLKAEFRKDVKHERGIVSMAHGDDPDSATTSFFLMLGAAPSLDGNNILDIPWGFRHTLNMETATTLQQAIVYFSDFENCRKFMVELRWPNGAVKCPRCGAEKVTWLAKTRVWKCYAKHERPTFTLKTGTIFEDSPIPLEKWLTAAWLIISCKNGISSYEIHRGLGVTQKTAWFMLHRVRLAMQDDWNGGKIGGPGTNVEVDETFIGGKARNMHPAKRDKAMTGFKSGSTGKAIVQGMLERGGKVRAKVVPQANFANLMPNIREHVELGSRIVTDELSAYKRVGDVYYHEVINHLETYVKGNVHTNGIENFWSLLKRGLNGTYVAVEPFHLFRYVDEQAFRFNTRKDTDAERFAAVMKQIVGRRLTYSELTGKVESGREARP